MRDMSLSKLLSGWRLFTSLSIVPLAMTVVVAILDPSSEWCAQPSPNVDVLYILCFLPDFQFFFTAILVAE